MSTAQVLAAAAALREFDLDQVAAFCDEPSSVILTVLGEASECVVRVGSEPTRWRVADAAELRRRIRAAEPQSAPVVDDQLRARLSDRIAVTRLDYAEQTLLDWDEQRPYEERRLRLAAANNALRQALATMTATGRPWWQLEVRPGGIAASGTAPGIGEEDALTAARLQFTVEVAFLTGQHLARRELSTPDLVAAAHRSLACRGVDLRQLFDLVARFVDLVLGQAAPTEAEPAPSRLLAALARRHVRDLVDHSVEGGLCALVPLLENVGRDGGRSPELYEELAELPSGRKHIVVFTDLLELLPDQLRYRAEGTRLPGTLTEAVTEPDTTAQLRANAIQLEQDLVLSPYPSDRALIGSAVHTLQWLTEREARVDRSLRDRSDARCAQLLHLATVSVP